MIKQRVPRELIGALCRQEFVHGINIPYFPGVASGDFNGIQGRRLDTTHLLFLFACLLATKSKEF